MFNELVGMRVQKVESSRRGIVVKVRDGSGMVDDHYILEMECGYSGLYSRKSLQKMVHNGGKHEHNCE